MNKQIQTNLHRIRPLEANGWRYDWFHDELFGHGEGWRNDLDGEAGLTITRAIIHHCRRGSGFRHPLLVAVVTTVGDLVYRLEFPLHQLANAIAICGWGIVAAIAKTDLVRRELARLEQKQFLEIPEKPERWFQTFGIRTA